MDRRHRLIAPATVRIELAEDITARAIEACVPLLEGASVPEHIRTWSSADVLAIEADIAARLIDRQNPGQPMTLREGDAEGLDVAQRDAVAALAGTAEVLVVEGAAGAGKTTTLATTARLLAAQGRRLRVVTPTLKSARVAGRELGASDPPGDPPPRLDRCLWPRGRRACGGDRRRDHRVRGLLDTARDQVRTRRHEPAIRSLPRGRIE